MSDSENGPGMQDQSLPASIAANTAVLARQRTPTLLSGEIAGSQGQVQVWSPDTAAIRKHTRIAFGLAGLIVVMLAAAVASGSLALLMLLYLPALYSAWLCAATLPAYRKPRYITTDDAGIGITTKSGSRSFPWDDLMQATFTYSGGLYLKLRSGECVHVNLYGYTPVEIWALFDLIVRSADLTERRSRHLIDGKSFSLPGCQDRFPRGKSVSPQLAGPSPGTVQYLASPADT